MKWISALVFIYVVWHGNPYASEGSLQDNSLEPYIEEQAPDSDEGDQKPELPPQKGAFQKWEEDED